MIYSKTFFSIYLLDFLEMNKPKWMMQDDPISEYINIKIYIYIYVCIYISLYSNHLNLVLHDKELPEHWMGSTTIWNYNLEFGPLKSVLHGVGPLSTKWELSTLLNLLKSCLAWQGIACALYEKYHYLNLPFWIWSI